MPTVNWTAFGGDPDHYDLLKQDAVERWREIGQSITANYTAHTSPELMGRLSGCMDALSVCLQQIDRIRAHHDALFAAALAIINEARDVPPSAPMVAHLRGAGLCGDFEGLLLHGRAALDRLAWAVSNHFRQRTQSYRSLGRTLANHRNDVAAKAVLGVMRAAQHHIDFVYTSTGTGHESLRDLAGHKQALTDRTIACVGVWRFEPSRVLMFDWEVRAHGSATFGIFDTVAESLRYLPMIVIDCVSVMLGRGALPDAAYTPKWSPRSVRLSRYIDEQASLSEGFTSNTVTFAVRMTPDGFQMRTVRVRKDAFDYAVSVPPPAAGGREE